MKIAMDHKAIALTVAIFLWVCMYVKTKKKAYSLNMCSLLYVNHTSKKLFKKESYVIINIFSPSCPLSSNFIYFLDHI